MKLPRVDAIAGRLGDERPHRLRVEAARHAIAAARARALARADRGGSFAVDAADLADDGRIVAEAHAWLERRGRPRLRKVINATGVIVHTNLGRAPLPVAAILPALGYCNLEYELATGERGSRRAAVEPLLVELTGAEAALVVNNVAAALVLALATVGARSHPAGAREVIVSRGELVEIGGSFRIPEILESAGVRLVEVGTTNRTRAADYERAIGPRTAAILRVHPSNFHQSGFVARPALGELTALARAAAIPCLVDLGSDALWPLDPDAWPLPSQDDTLSAALAADLAIFSGDKLLGGPQAGIALGRRDLVDAMAKAPLMRALRPDKLALAALDYVLRARLEQAPERVPVLAMITTTSVTLRARAEALAHALANALANALEDPGANAPPFACEVIATDDPIGGGSHPETTLPGAGLALTPSMGVDEALRRLRSTEPPVIARAAGGRVVIALRTVAADDQPLLVAALIQALGAAP